MVKYNRSTEKLKHILFSKKMSQHVHVSSVTVFCLQFSGSDRVFFEQMQMLRVCVIFSIFGYTWSQCTVKNKKEKFCSRNTKEGKLCT